MKTCYITDRLTLPPGVPLLDNIARCLAHGVDWIQIREKDLPARELFALVKQALALPNPAGSKIIVNTRMDVALAAGAAGCHLPSDSPAPSFWKKPAGFLLGVSCHQIDEVRAAEAEGADYVVFGPVFSPLSKSAPLPATGLAPLHAAASAIRIPVLALGGITNANIPACLAAGAAGIAAISLFQKS